MGKFYEDLNVGDRFVTAGKTMTDTHISTMVAFSGYIMPIFIDDEAARKTPFGSRVCPGRITMAAMGGLLEQVDILDLGGVVAAMEISKVRFPNPVRPGDTIRVEFEVTGKKETSRPDRGILIHKEICLNQRNEVVVELEAAHLMKKEECREVNHG